MRQTGLGKAFLKIKELISSQEFMGMDDPFSDGETERISNPYRSHSLVNIAVSTLMRNIGRASFRITRDGEFVTSGPGSAYSSLVVRFAYCSGMHPS